MMHGDGVSRCLLACLLGIDSPRYAKPGGNMLKYALLPIPHRKFEMRFAVMCSDITV